MEADDWSPAWVRLLIVSDSCLPVVLSSESDLGFYIAAAFDTTQALC